MARTCCRWRRQCGPARRGAVGTGRKRGGRRKGRRPYWTHASRTGSEHKVQAQAQARTCVASSPGRVVSRAGSVSWSMCAAVCAAASMVPSVDGWVWVCMTVRQSAGAAPPVPPSLAPAKRVLSMSSLCTKPRDRRRSALFSIGSVDGWPPFWMRNHHMRALRTFRTSHGPYHGASVPRKTRNRRRITSRNNRPRSPCSRGRK